RSSRWSTASGAGRSRKARARSRCTSPWSSRSACRCTWPRQRWPRRAPRSPLSCRQGSSRFERWSSHSSPRPCATRCWERSSAVGEKWGGWVGGQLVLMLAIGVMAGVGYLVLGLPSPFLLAAFAATAEMIPMVGPFLAFLPAVLVAFTISPGTALVVVLFALVI